MEEREPLKVCKECGREKNFVECGCHRTCRPIIPIGVGLAVATTLVAAAVGVSAIVTGGGAGVVVFGGVCVGSFLAGFLL